MIVNGITILSPTHLEQIIVDMDNPNKDCLRMCYCKELEEITLKINDRIQYFQSVATPLLIDLYSTNTTAGITLEQSDQMFDDYADVLTRIKEGAFPTAYYRLCQKQPEGFVTQGLIDSWKSKILKYLQG
ncbi:MAG TPA: hypothetical protein VI911_12030 [Patescibacteria group bacterium]|nr:hypothetical protein [Patescibacteria group bacterium]